MSTFRDCAPIRHNLWIVCHRCRRTTHIDPKDPLIADRPAGQIFSCTKCGNRVTCNYADPRAPGEAWEVTDRTIGGPTF